MERTRTAFWSLHTHSSYSAKDAIVDVGAVVARAKELGYVALGMTDHGNVSATVQLYTACRKAGIKPLPGMEAYFTFDSRAKRPRTAHMLVLAHSEQGYRNLARLSTQTYAEFRYKPLLSAEWLSQASELGWLEGLLCTTGCWFGVLPTTLREAGEEAALNVLESFRTWFDGRAYVELQRHMIDASDHGHDEIEFAYRLKGLADEVGLGCVLTQDSHYAHKCDREHHDTLKELVTFSEDPDSAKFPGDGYHMVDTTWMRERWPVDLYNAGMAGLKEIASYADVVIPELEDYRLKVPDVTGSKDPDVVLSDLAWSSPYASQPDYADRIAQELDVVQASGFSSYLLFASTVCQWMRDEGIAFSVRGSVSGSLLCYLLRISSLDPLVWDLRFDRFLSKDRMKPPDIDIDVQHDRRQEVIDWLESQYPLRHICTWMRLGLTESDEGTKGSLLVKYKSVKRNRGLDPEEELTPLEWDRLNGLAEYAPISGFGVHPAGLLITPDEATMASVPLMWAPSSKMWVTAYDKDDVERLGLVKLDLLGLKTLTGVKRACEIAGVEPWEWEDYDDPEVYRMLTRSTAGVFQLEGRASSYGMKSLKPDCIDDIIAAMALFRPATLSSGSTNEYCAIKNGQRKRVRRHPIIWRHTHGTYGVLLYQEQVIGILRDMGMSAEDLTDTLKAVKASNGDVGGASEHMRAIAEDVRLLCRSNGMNRADTNWVVESLSAYAGYSFNKAHATAYGHLAYATAWLRRNHAAAFWTGMLNAYVGAKQEELYVDAARRDGIKFASAHVNMAWRPGDGYALYEGAVCRGLSTIKGIGDGAARSIIENAPYASLNDFGERVNRRLVSGSNDLLKYGKPGVSPGVVGALYRANALHGLQYVEPEKKPTRRRKKEEDVRTDA